MNLQKLVIHEIQKEAQSTGAALFLSEQVQDVSESRPQRLHEKLAAALSTGNSKVDYAVFLESEEFPFRLHQYLESEQTEDDFIEFSRVVTSNLKDQIMNIPAAKGGYLIFSDYVSQQKQYVAVFLVRNTTGDIFRHAEDFLRIDEVIYADTSKLAMACRINVPVFLGESGKPLLLINRRSQEVSEYFSRWLGASDKESSEEYSELLYKIISNLPPPQKPNSADSFTIDETRKRVFELIKVEANGIANLNTISEVVYGNPTTISHYIEKFGIEIPTEFKTYPNSMKKFVQVRVNRDGILLQMSRGDLSRVSFGENQDTVIITSRALADDLRQQKSDIPF